jgi:hypothetical protein
MITGMVIMGIMGFGVAGIVVWYVRMMEEKER